MGIAVGIFVIGIGFLFVWKSEWLLNNVGRVGWAEQHLGMEGGTRIFYKLLGLLIMIGSFLFMTGLGGRALRAIFTSSGP